MENFPSTYTETINATVRAAICLHNFLSQTNSASSCPKTFTDSYDSTSQIKEGEWTAMVKFNDGMPKDIPGVRGSCPSLSALEVRNEVKRYVNSMTGSLFCQWEHIRSRDSFTEIVCLFV